MLVGAEQQGHFAFESTMQDLDDESAQAPITKAMKIASGAWATRNAGWMFEYHERQGEEYAERDHFMLDSLELE